MGGNSNIRMASKARLPGFKDELLAKPGRRINCIAVGDGSKGTGSVIGGSSSIPSIYPMSRRFASQRGKSKSNNNRRTERGMNSQPKRWMIHVTSCTEDRKYDSNRFYTLQLHDFGLLFKGVDVTEDLAEKMMPEAVMRSVDELRGHIVKIQYKEKPPNTYLY